MSKLWLKPKAENVSQSDLRRIAEEKAARATPPDNRPPVNEAPVQSAPPDERQPAESTPVESSPGTPPQTEALLPESHPLTIDHLLPANAPHLRTPYATIDRLRQLSPGPRVVCEEIFRAAAGWHSDECVISVPKLAVYCKIDEKYVRKYLAQLQALGFIERLANVQGGPDIQARGVRFRILLPRLTPPDKKTPVQSSGSDNRPPNKDKAINKLSKSAVCDCYKEPPIGYYYPSGEVGKGTPKKCDHGTGK